MDMDMSHLGSEIPYKMRNNPFQKTGNAPFDKEFYMIINMSVASDYFRSDIYPDKDWK